jgi:hypothetical protein
MRRGIVVAVIVFSLLIPVIGTSCDSTQDSGAEAVIGSEGGVVEVTAPSSELAGTRIVIPEGSLAEDAVISIAPSEVEPPTAGEKIECLSLPAFEVSISDGDLNLPAQIEVPVADEDNDGFLDGTDYPLDSFSLLRLVDEESEEYERVETWYDVDRHLLVGETDTFSIWIPWYWRWMKDSTVYYCVSSVPGNTFYSGESMEAEVELAFDMWSEALGGTLIFEEVSAWNPLIDIWIEEDSTPNQAPAEATPHWAPADVRTIKLYSNYVHSGKDRLWVSGDYEFPAPDLGEYHYVPFLRILAHEISHALGVNYDADQEFDTNPVYGPYDVVRQDYLIGAIEPWYAVPLTRLSGFDIREIRKKYDLEPFEVSFPDTNLEDAIREAIGKPSGPIYLADLESLSTFDAAYGNIVDVAGLEYCTNLHDLQLHGNQIDDISPLSSLSNLTLLILGHAGLDGNLISDVKPLSFLMNLDELYLGVNQVIDISPLANLAKLTQLFLSDNQIMDISPLASLTNLTRLELDSNEISDVSPLVDNLGLGEGDSVILIYNPLSDDSINIYIPELEARGADVLY